MMPTEPARWFVNNSQRNYSRYSSKARGVTLHKFQVPSSYEPSCPAVSCVPGLSHLKKKKGSDPTFEARLFQVDAITGEDVSSLETQFEAGVDEQTGLCVFSPRASEDELS